MNELLFNTSYNALKNAFWRELKAFNFDKVKVITKDLKSLHNARERLK